MERIRQEAERFRRHDEAQEKAAAAFRESLRVGDILYSSWGWEQTNIDFYQVIAIRGSAVDLLHAVLVDCGSVIVHCMQPAVRDYYNLVELWGPTPMKRPAEPA